jgi:hypothetical protein
MNRIEFRQPQIAWTWKLCCAVACAAHLCVAGADAAGPDTQKTAQPDASRPTKYLRVSRGEDQEPTALETAVTRFVGQRGDARVQVDLIGAVHVGERSYYDELNKLFTSYDAVLYELVAPEGTRVEPGQRKSGHPVSFLQNMMKDVLGLEFQLDRIDYSTPNMVHADMSPKEFSQSMKDRNESFFKMFLRAMGQAMSSQAQQKSAPSDMELLVALVAKDRDYRLKRLMAEQFENMEGQLTAINGPDGSTIITERNKKALQVLRQQLGKGRKRIGIFYGAGHLSDMAERLENDFGLERDSQRWLVAWRIAPPEPQEQKKDVPAESAVIGDQE